MAGQMCWLACAGGDGDKILHLRLQPNQPWQPYTAYPQFSVADYNVPRGSKGWATYQKLMKAGWALMPSASNSATRELSAARY